MKTIIVSLIMLCTGILNCMELEKWSYESLPKELKQEIIITFLATSKNLDEMINTIKTCSALNTQFYKLVNNLKNFTTLMNVLAEKFPDEVRETIAQKFNTPIAKHYLVLGGSFISNVINHNTRRFNSKDSELKLKNAYRLFEKGVDPNFSWLKGISTNSPWEESHDNVKTYSLLSKADWHISQCTYKCEKCTFYKNLATLLLERGAIPFQSKTYKIARNYGYLKKSVHLTIR